ncbi:MAG TPA: hypothetical protein VHY10_16285 [Xanthobacteraceae bacterium]|jgi:hypothetical protein|nr:hypothetical protein [Xanthobacteraceae bacterium]
MAPRKRSRLAKKAAAACLPRGVPPLDENDAATLGNLLRRVVFEDFNRVSDRVFDRIEDRIESLVRLVARRVVPDNVATAIDTAVTNRTAAIEETLRSLMRDIGRVQLQLAKPTFRRVRRAGK